jgi:alpha/beta superfamily hydrolase
MNADATAACSVALKRRSYDQVALIGKSIGTLVLGHLISTHPELDEPRCIWLTPLLRNERLRSQITQTRHRGLFVIGTADPHYDHAKLAAIQEATGGESIIIQGADHSMEIDGKVAESIQALQRIMLGIQSFLFGGKR